MPLDKITAINFQSHKKTELGLHPNINAITGASDVGKSSITRIVEWVRTNRPTGNAFQSHWAGKEGTKGELTFDGIKVTRHKSKTINNYQIDQTEFNVVKTDVPQEVQDFINLDDINIQGQHDRYFLMQDTSGEVARKLNKIANIDIIDFVLSEADSDIRKSNQNVALIEKTIEETTIELEAYKDLDTIEVLVEKIVELTTQQEETTETIESLQSTIDYIQETEKEIKVINDWLEIENELTPLIKVTEELNEVQKERISLQTAVENITELEEQIQTLSERAGCEKEVEAILGYIQEYRAIGDEIRALNSLLLNIDNTAKGIEMLEKQIEERTNQIVKLISKNKVCPLCGGNIKEDISKHIGGWL